MVKPTFSIIIPTRHLDENSNLEECLSALNNQNDIRQEEVILVNDGGEPKFSKEKYPNLNIQIIHLKENSGIPKARNAGIPYANNEIIITLDDDSIPTKDWLKNFRKAWEIHQNFSGIGGIITYEENDSIISKVNAHLFNHIIMPDENCQKTTFIVTNNGSFKKEILIRIGGFKETIGKSAGSDTDLSLRMIKSGHTLIYDESIKVFHARSVTLKSFLLKFFFYGWSSSYLNIGKSSKGKFETIYQLFGKKNPITYFLRLCFKTLTDKTLIEKFQSIILIIFSRIMYWSGFILGSLKIIRPK